MSLPSIGLLCGLVCAMIAAGLLIRRRVVFPPLAALLAGVLGGLYCVLNAWLTGSADAVSAATTIGVWSMFGAVIAWVERAHPRHWFDVTVATLHPFTWTDDSALQDVLLERLTGLCLAASGGSRSEEKYAYRTFLLSRATDLDAFLEVVRPLPGFACFTLGPRWPAALEKRYEEAAMRMSTEVMTQHLAAAEERQREYAARRRDLEIAAFRYGFEPPRALEPEALLQTIRSFGPCEVEGLARFDTPLVRCVALCHDRRTVWSGRDAGIVMETMISETLHGPFPAQPVELASLPLSGTIQAFGKRRLARVLIGRQTTPRLLDGKIEIHVREVEACI